MRRSELLKEVNDYVSKAVSRLERKRYAQESAYVDAFLGRLDGKINFDNKNAVIDLQSTVVADRGPGAAEHKFGADFALVFKSNCEALKINKAIIAQAKNGILEQLSTSEKTRLTTQCRKMAEVTQHYFVLEAPTENYVIPTVRLGTFQDKQWSSAQIPFGEYLVDYIISCKHGDRRGDFIDAVGDSKLSTLKVNTTNLTFEPDPPDDNYSFCPKF
ncbi:MAG: hypothetical protein FDZ72_16950 [Betaproteobacteria bacterium]|nr:MAG: hypothetical protein FDZ72_16950 [Betaproteobacteria bacterium]